MDGFGELPNAFHNTYAFVLNEQIFLLHALPSLYSLSITCLSPRLCLTTVEDRTHLIIFTESTKHKALSLEKTRRAAWCGWLCQGTSRWYPEVQLKIFLSPGLLISSYTVLFSLSKLFENMLTFTVSSITLDIKW